MHRKNIQIYIQQDATLHSLLYLETALRVSAVHPPIIRSTNNCIYSIWYLSHLYCYLPLYRQVAVTVWQIPDAVDTVVCAPDDGWRNHPKHVEQFPDKINRVTLHLVGYIYILECDNKHCALWRSKQACPRRFLFSKCRSTVGCTPVKLLNQCMPTRNYGLSCSCADFHVTHTYLTALRADILHHISHKSWAVISQSVLRLATGWTVRGSNPGGGKIFRICPDQPWGPSSLPYNGYRVFPGSKAAGAWRWQPTLSSAEVKERVEL